MVPMRADDRSGGGGAAVRRFAPAGIAVRIADDQPTFWDRVERGGWEPGLLAALGRLVGPGTTLLDLGAWVGPVSLLAAGLGARVVAVEADPAALAQLRRNLAANPDLAGRVTVVPRAVSAEPGPVRLGARRKPGDSMSSVLLAAAGTAWETPSVTPAELDALLGEAPALVVKIDIEGGEYRLLPALAPLLARRLPAVILSLHPAILRDSGAADPTAATVAALAGFAGWQAFRLDGAEPAAWPVAAILSGREPCDEWLFLPPGRILPAAPAGDGPGGLGRAGPAP